MIEPVAIAKKVLQGIVLASLMFLLAQARPIDGTTVRGKITYVVGTSVYTSLGRKSGVSDSCNMFVIAKGDTIATLRVYATSSQSSVCRILTAKRDLKIGDSLLTFVQIKKDEEPSPPKLTSLDSTVTPPTASTMHSEHAASPGQNTAPPVSVRGRVSMQYYTNVVSGLGVAYSQPGLVFNLHGAISNTPVNFEAYGNIRSLITGSGNLFSSQGKSQSRIYRLSLGFDDGVNVAALGRIIPSYSSSAGYVDGGFYARKFGEIVLGGAAGFEPDFSQQGVSTAMKKFSVFGTYQSSGYFRPFLSAAYAKTFYDGRTDREILNSTFSGAFTDDISLYSQAEVDLRTKSRSAFLLKPHLTSLYSSLNFRLSNELSCGVGYNSWRPSYPFSTIKDIPDSFIDNTARGTLSLTGQYFTPWGISIFHTYSPRTSQGRLGDEYLDNTTVTFNNLLHSGVVFRTNFVLNSNSYTSTRGLGANLTRSIGIGGNINLRFQNYRNTIQQSGIEINTRSIALDLMWRIVSGLNAWTSLERLSGGGNDTYNIFVELSISF